jgi:hypothetical protein
MPEGEFVTTGLPEEARPEEARDPLYERQLPLGLRQPSVILVGCGGVGCWIALALVLGGVETIHLFDGDSLSVHNLNRFPLPASNVGEGKSVALAHWLSTLRPKAEIMARGEFDSSIHTTQAEYVVCATDSLKSRQMCYAYSKEIGSRYLEVGADGERWTLSPAPPEFSTDLEQNAGYATVPVHVGPCMMAASAAVYYILHATTPVMSHSAKWIGGIGELDIQSILEVEDEDTVECEICHSFRVYRSGSVRGSRVTYIELIKHVRAAHPGVGGNLGLVEAKGIVDKWWKGQATTPVPEATPDMAHVSEVGVWHAIPGTITVDNPRMHTQLTGIAVPTNTEPIPTWEEGIDEGTAEYVELVEEEEEDNE